MEKIKLEHIFLRVPKNIIVCDKKEGIEVILEAYVNGIRFFSHISKKSIEEIDKDSKMKLFLELVNGIYNHIEMGKERFDWLCEAIYQSYFGAE